MQHVEKPSKWALHRLQPLPVYVDGYVAVLGDAVSQKLKHERSCKFGADPSTQAHAMAPHQGSGAGQGIEVSATYIQVSFSNFCL